MTEPEFRDETAGMPVEDDNPDGLETSEVSEAGSEENAEANDERQF